MSHRQSLLVIAGAALGLGSVAHAGGADLDRAYAAELSADAAQRTSLLRQAGTGQPGFTIASGDGTGSLNVSGLLQFRYMANFRSSDNPDNVDPTDQNRNKFTHGFETARTQLRFTGHVINPDLTFNISGDFSDAPRPSTFLFIPDEEDEEENGNGNGSAFEQGTFNLKNAYAQYNFEGQGQGFFVRWGQFKLPILTEELIAPENQLAVERSITNEFFSGRWSQGILFGYRADSFEGSLTVSDGLGAANSSFNSPIEADISLTARIDAKLAGDWEQFERFTSWRGSEDAARVGGAFHWQSSGDTNPQGPSSNQVLYTIDGTYLGDGFNIYGAFIGSHQSRSGASDLDDFGLIIQGGAFVSEELELFARWDALFLDSDRFEESTNDAHFITVGANYYIVPNSQAAKLTADLVWAINKAGGLSEVDSASTGTGILGDNKSGEIAVRAQLQLLF